MQIPNLSNDNRKQIHGRREIRLPTEVDIAGNPTGLRQAKIIAIRALAGGYPFLANAAYNNSLFKSA